MKLKVLALIILLVLSSVVFAEDPEEPKPILKEGDVKHFIKTFPLLKEEFKKYDVKHKAKSGDITYTDSIKASSEFMAILKKHGWDEQFFAKTTAISMGYSMIVYSKEIEKADPKMEKAIKEIESNPHLSEAMKKQTIAQIKMAKGVLKSQKSVFKRSVHKADMELVKPHIEMLKKVLESD